MKLPIPSFGNKKIQIDYYLALLLRDDKVKSIIFEETNGKIKVVSTHTEHFSTSLENADMKEMLDTFDKAIGTAENALPESINVKKTIFGVKESWVEENKIKKEYLTKLKKISQELDLQPVGFLVFTEAIAHYLYEEQGTPLSALVIELGKQNINIAIFRAGKIITTTSKEIGDSPIKTTEKILQGIENLEILPSKMIIFDGEHANKVTNEFTKYEWKKTLPFLHPPEVIVLPTDIDIKAILFGTAAQLGLEISEMEIKKAEVDITEENENSTTEEKTENINKKKFKEPILTAENFGFVTDSDIAAINASRSDREQEDNFSEKDEEIEDEKHIETKEEKTAIRMLLEKVLPIKTIGKLAELKNKKDNEIKSAAMEIENEETINHSAKNKKNTIKVSKKLLIGVPALLILLIAGIILYVTKVKATVTLTLAPKMLSQTQQIVFSSQDDNNFSQNIIHGEAMTTSIQTQTTTQATGTKNIGDKAKGTVTIYNNNADPKTVPAGTVLTSSNNLKFTLDKDITVASQSGDQFSGTKPGTSDGTVTANDIGTEFNLPSGATFSLGTTGTVVAKNSSAFSGGTKKQVTIVTQNDLDKLKTDAINNSQDKAKQQLSQNSSNDKSVVPAITTIELDKTKSTYDHKVGDQTSNITLNAVINYTSIAYNKTQLIDYAKTILQGKIQPDQIIASNGITTNITDTKVQNDHQLQATLTIQVSLFPILDNNKLSEEITGKSFLQAQNFLSSQPQVNNVSISLSPNIPLFPKILPRFIKNITIKTNN